MAGGGVGGGGEAWGEKGKMRIREEYDIIIIIIIINMWAWLEHDFQWQTTKKRYQQFSSRTVSILFLGSHCRSQVNKQSIMWPHVLGCSSSCRDHSRHYTNHAEQTLTVGFFLTKHTQLM
jgi:hypothetical protein